MSIAEDRDVGRHSRALPAADLTILIPTRNRPAALAVTLGSLIAQRAPGFRVVISDQSDGASASTYPEVATALRALEVHGHPVEFLVHLPARGMAEQRAFLLAQASTEYVLFLDDDLLLAPGVLRRLLTAIRNERCGFVGCAPLGLSYADDLRPEEHPLELWEGQVAPERIRPGGPEWSRHALHNAANLLHVQQSFGEFAEDEYLPYKIAWVGGCVLFDSAALRCVGGFEFWRDLPAEHAGEDVVAQLRVMERFGGCAIMPSDVYHLEVPTTIAQRAVDAPHHL